MVPLYLTRKIAAAHRSRLSRSVNDVLPLARWLSVQTLSDEAAVTSFSNAASESKSVIYFTAAWCGPCQQIKPVLDQLSEKYDGDIAFGKVDVDENVESAANYAVRVVPTFILRSGSEQVARLEGADPSSLPKQIENLKEVK